MQRIDFKGLATERRNVCCAHGGDWAKGACVTALSSLWPPLNTAVVTRIGFGNAHVVN